MEVNRRTTLGLLAGGMALPFMSAQSAFAAPLFPAEPKVIMDLYQGDKVIGQHSYEITGTQAAPVVQTKAAFRGRVFGFKVKYDLATVETWANGQLSQLRSRGELRGENFEVSADREGDMLSIINARGRRLKADPAIMPTTYWMPNFVQQRQVLDTQRGRVLTIDPQPLGVGSFRGRMVQGWDVGGELPIKIFYDSTGTWSGLRFTLLGTDFEYQRV